MEERQKQIDKIWRDSRWLWFLPGLTVGLLIGLPIQLGDAPASWFLDGIWPEALGIIFTVFIIDRLYTWREEQRRMIELKARLIREAQSTVNDVAVQAINEMRSRNWLDGDDGLLKGRSLRGANLSGASFKDANLIGCDLQGARLCNTILADANLRDANLTNANLEGAILDYAILSNAKLRNANLTGASLLECELDGANLTRAIIVNATLQLANLRRAVLEGAELIDSDLEDADFANANLGLANLSTVIRMGGVNFQGAILLKANLTASNLWGAKFDFDTIMPDGSPYEYGMDLTKFTNP